jgi:hypothetical protein
MSLFFAVILIGPTILDGQKVAVPVGLSRACV